jgi:hypothetical protein
MNEFPGRQVDVRPWNFSDASNNQQLWNLKLYRNRIISIIAHLGDIWF